MNLTYTPISQDDISPILSLCRSLVEAYEDPDAVDLGRVMDWMRRKLEVQRGDYRRILADGRLVGYFAWHPMESGAELDDFYILPEHRRRGIGTAVLRDWCERTPGAVELCVFVRNTGAIRLYERMGFRMREEVSRTRRIMQRDPGPLQIERRENDSL